MAFAEGEGRGLQPYKYNGKELDETNSLNQYDYSARYYDPAEMRFTTIDPLAEKYYSWSPYAYVANNPMKFIDPTGEDWRDVLNGVIKGVEQLVTAPVATAKNIAENGISLKEITHLSKGIRSAQVGSVVDIVAAAGRI